MSGELGGILPRRIVGELSAAIGQFYGNNERYALEPYYLYERSVTGMPMAVRLKRGAEPTPLDVVLRDIIDGTLSETHRQQCGWLVDMPIPWHPLHP